MYNHYSNLAQSNNQNNDNYEEEEEVEETSVSMQQASAGQQLAIPANLLIDLDRLSYEEYFCKINKMIDQMHQFWKQEQRVKSLKTIIQLTKLLANSNQAKLYQRKYKLITEALDEFGQLMYNRIHLIDETYDPPRRLANEENDQIGGGQLVSEGEEIYDNSMSKEQAHELAKDICRNWFLKVASIRELVPRFYCELAILRACDVLIKHPNDNQSSNSLWGPNLKAQLYAQSLDRLSKAAWGLGDPIVALHARAYLAKVAERLIGCNHHEQSKGTRTDLEQAGVAPTGWEGEKRHSDGSLWSCPPMLATILGVNLENSLELITMINVRGQLKQLKLFQLEQLEHIELLLNSQSTVPKDSSPSKPAGPHTLGDTTARSRRPTAATCASLRASQTDPSNYKALFELMSAPLQSILAQLGALCPPAHNSMIPDPFHRPAADDEHFKGYQERASSSTDDDELKLDKILAKSLAVLETGPSGCGGGGCGAGGGSESSSSKDATTSGGREEVELEPQRSPKSALHNGAKGPHDRPLRHDDDADRALARNVILYSVCRALPSDLVAVHARDLLANINTTVSLWKVSRMVASLASLTTDVKPLSSNIQTNDMTSSESKNSQTGGPLALGGAKIQPKCHPQRQGAPNDLALDKLLLYSMYSTLNSLLIALIASERLELLEDRQKLCMKIMTNANEMLETFFQFEQKLILSESGPSETLLLASNDDQRGQEATILNDSTRKAPNRTDLVPLLSPTYLRCFKTLVTFAGQQFNAATDSLANGRSSSPEEQCQISLSQTELMLKNLLSNFVGKIQSRRNYANYYCDILDLIKIIFTTSNKTSGSLEHFARLFQWTSFKKLLDFLRKDEHKLECSKWILETIRSNIRLAECSNKRPGQNEDGKSVGRKCTNRVTISFLLRLFSMLNDSLSPLTALDELEHLSHLIVFYLQLISIEDHQERLEFYVKCRSCLSNLNAVLEFLIRKVLFELIDEQRKVEKRRAWRRNFLNACLAYSFVTIPTVNHYLTVNDEGEDCKLNGPHRVPVIIPNDCHAHQEARRLQIRSNLYIEGTRLALKHMSLSIGDYYLRHTIEILEELFTIIQQQNQETRENISPVCNGKCGPILDKLMEIVLNLVIKHQDHVDLKVRLSLIDLIQRYSAGGGETAASLLQTSHQLASLDDPLD